MAFPAVPGPGTRTPLTTAAEYNKMYQFKDHITLPYLADDAVVAEAVKSMKG